MTCGRMYNRGFSFTSFLWPQSHSMQDLSSLTRDLTHAPYIGSTESWTTREVPSFTFDLSHHHSVAQSCSTLCNPMDSSIPGFPVLHHFKELAQMHIHWVGDAIQPSHPLLSPSPPAFNLCQHQGVFQWVSSSHQVAKVLEFQLQHQSFRWIFRTDFL